jgi:GWxTD domain-containing protein
MNKTIRHIAIAFFGALLLASCSGQKGLAYKNMAQNYQQESVLVRPEFTLQHINDSVSRLYFSVNSSELLYSRELGSDTFKTAIRVSYNFIKSFDSELVLDSGKIIIKDQMIELVDKKIHGSIDVKTKATSGILYITAMDLVRNYDYTDFIRVKRESGKGRQDFALFDDRGNRLYSPYLRPGKKVIIHHREIESHDLIVRYYNRDFPTAAPPYVITNQKSFDYRADSIFLVKLGDTITIPDLGFYHLQLDSNQAAGVTLFAFDESFPYVTRVSQLMPPMRYITSSREYEALESKKQVDEFWIRNASSPERAKHLISNYYGRVEDANRFFSSYQPGWKTDRGIIYTVFGPPNIIYKSENGETWIYGDENSMLSYNFNFVRVENPFTDNDFALNRSSVYRYSWSQAVDTWRQGRVFNVSDVQRAQDEAQRQLTRPYFWY